MTNSYVKKPYPQAWRCRRWGHKRKGLLIPGKVLKTTPFKCREAGDSKVQVILCPRCGKKYHNIIWDLTVLVIRVMKERCEQMKEMFCARNPLLGMLERNRP